MAFKYTEEQLNKLDKELLIQLFLGLQDQMEELTKQTQALNDKMQLMMEQIVLSNKSRFGRSSEKMADPGQIRFMEVDGKIVFFNEAEAVCDLTAPEPDALEIRAAKKKKQIGKKNENSFQMPYQDVTALCLQKSKLRNIISEFMPVKPMDTWSKHHIQRTCSAAALSPHPLQRLLSTASMSMPYRFTVWKRSLSAMALRSPARTWPTG